MRREPTEVKDRVGRGRWRPAVRGVAATRSRLRRLTLESLEARALMATAPLPIVANQTSVSFGSEKRDDSSPWVAIDPINPLKMVAVFTTRDTSSGQTIIFSQAQATTDGGKHWSSVGLPGNLGDPTTSNPVKAFSQAKASGVGFDRSENVYIGILEVNDAGNAGAAVVQKYNFSGGSPSLTNPNNVAYGWNQAAQGQSGQPAMVDFSLAVDGNLLTFTDPDTGAVQADPNAGSVYVAATMNTPPPSGAGPSFNPYEVALVASTDGTNFGGLTFLDGSIGGSFGPQRDVSPRVAIDGGRAGGAAGGKVTVVWDDYGSLALANPPRDVIWSVTATIAGTTVSPGAASQVTTTVVRGALTPNYSLASPASPIGIGPAPAIASDQTLGSFSPHQGRLYVTYVDKYTDILNPADNSDIFLRTSDDGGASWSFPVQVNTDSAAHDGHTESAAPFDAGVTAKHPAGRSQFEPAVAVDQSTGTVALSWLDARDDASRSRYATYLTTSIDGGRTFSPQAFANRPAVVKDAITGKGVVIGPMLDSQAGSNPNTEGSISFGTHQGLAIGGGLIHPVWAGTVADLGGGLIVGDAFKKTRLTIETAQASYPAGPRIIAGSMGPVGVQTFNNTPAGTFTFNNTYSASDHTQQLDGFTVTFDRPVDVSSFRPSSVRVVYRDTVTPLGSPGTPVAVGAGIRPLDSAFGGAEATTFYVPFATPQSAVGTYSYAVGPGIRDRLRGPSQVTFVPDAGPTTTAAASPQVPKHIDDFGTQVPNQPSNLDSTIAVSGFPAADVLAHISVTLQINHTYDSDLQITLVSPTGQRVVLSQNRGFNTQDFNTTTFDDAATTPISSGLGPFNGTYAPDQPLSSLNGGAANGTWTLNIQDQAAQDVGDLVSWSVTISSGKAVTSGGSNGNAMDQNANGIPGEASDIFAAPAPLGGAPFLAPYDTATLPLIVPGPHLVSSFVPGVANRTADNLALNATVGSLDVTFDRDMDPSTFAAAQVLRIAGPYGVVAGPYAVAPDPQAGENAARPRTFRITFPRQSLSGTYTVTMASSIKSAHGDAVDTNQNAGVDLLFDKSTPGTTTAQNTYSAAGLPLTIAPGKSVSSTINVTDNYLIKNFILGLDITYPSDPDLEATLTTPSGAVIRLFTRVGNIGPAGTQQNFTSTVFDDLAKTPIQNGPPPFFGRFNPQDPFSSLLTGAVQVKGTYTLTIKNDGTTPASTGTLNRWSLTVGQKDVLDTGLGEPVADRPTASFRIFTMDPTNPLASNTWTAVGPASNNANGNSSRIGGVALDPSDPSGNTAYVAGASGGVWKTYNFLTADPQGPTYIPLTDAGPDYGINIGGIAVFGRNNDPNQSVVVVATGEGDTSTPGKQGGGGTSKGVGFLLSTDGGATWTLMDSTRNVDAQGNIIPTAQRDHIFVGTTSYKVLVDPHVSPTGGVIIYAALSGGSSGGIWRSLDTGRTWQQMRKGEATDLVFDPNSAAVDAFTNPTGNIRTLYAAFRGDGVYLTPNQGSTWNQLAGGAGNGLIQDSIDRPVRSIPVANPPDTPNGGKGRIVLAKPALTGDPVLDTQYETWLYAAAVTPDDQFNGLYLTKDNGLNWTKVRLATRSNLLPDGSPDEVVPTQDIGQPDYNIARGQGNYDFALAIDPNNPAVVYLGGTRDFQPSTLIRVDTTRLADNHALYLDSTRLGGQTYENIATPVAIKDPLNLRHFFNPRTNAPDPDPLFNPYLNLQRDPNNPFLANSTILVDDTKGFTNDGSGAYWTPFVDILNFSTDLHRIVTLKDPVTGKTRLIVGLDQGVFTGVDNGDGTVLSSVGQKVLPTGSRNGNLQINQFYNGAAQPSALAAQIAGALFYGMAQDNGFPQSDPNVLRNGNLGWNGTGGDGTDVATDQTGSGTSYFTKWPCCINDGSAVTDFFKVRPNGPASTETSRTFGLIQKSGGGFTPDSQWPFGPSFNFAVNPITPNQMILGSGEGRLFGTENQGRIWNVLAEPSIFDGTTIPALAYGAPDPNGPGVPGALNNYLIVGTGGGHIYVTFTGGGGGSGNNWINLSAGLADGAGIQRIVTDPTRGSHDAFAISTDNVYYNADTSAAGSTWVKITGDIFAQQHNPFGDANLAENQARFLNGLAADWRYVIPDDPSAPNGAAHPMLYVGGEYGVYRSTDRGATWRAFPDQTLINDPARPVGGSLPVANVTDLDMVLGNVNPTTGRPDVSTGPNLLLATTYGRGSFGIRLAPIVFNDAVNAVTLTMGPQGQLIFGGLSEQTAFGSRVATTIQDITDPTRPIFLGGYDPSQGGPSGSSTFQNPANQTDAFGRFSVQGSYPAPPASSPYLYDGVRTIAIFATDASGTKGNVVTFQITNNPPTPAAPILTSNHLVSGGVDLTTVTNPSFSVTIPGNTTVPVTVLLIRLDAQGVATTVATQSVTGGGTITDPGPVPIGTYRYEVQYQAQTSTVLVTSPPSLPTQVQVIPGLTAALDPDDDSGIQGDNITNVRRPRFFGTGVPNPQSDPTLVLDLVVAASPAGSPLRPGTVLATAPDPNSGLYLIQVGSPLAVDGSYTVYVQARDSAGNTIRSSPVTFTLKTTPPAIVPTLAILPADDSGVKGDGRTIVRRPHLFGRTDPGAIVNVYSIQPDGSQALQATVTAQMSAGGGHPAGYYQFQLPYDLSNGTISLVAQATDAAGNTTAPSAPFRLTIYTEKGDYNGDGVADIGVYRPSNGTWYVLNSGGLPVHQTTLAYGNARHDVPIPADYDGDGRTDIAVFRPEGDYWIIRRSTLGEIVVQFGYPGHDTPVPAVYDSSGVAEIAVYRPEDSSFRILRNIVSAGNPSAVSVISYGTPNVDKPVPADYEGVGTDQVAVYDTRNGNWFVRNSTTGATDPVVNFGFVRGDIPVPADYDGIGRAEPAVYRPGTGQYIVFNPATNRITTTTVGEPNTDIPVPEDYTGDGKADMAVFRPRLGAWIYRDSATGAFAAPVFFGGKMTDVALPGPFGYRVGLSADPRGPGVPGGSTAGGDSGAGRGLALGSGSSSGTALTAGGAATATPRSAAAAMNVGASAPGGRNRRPNDGTPHRKLTLAAARPQAAPAPTPHDLALEGLGPFRNGRYFG